jgi:hypothetical protein
MINRVNGVQEVYTRIYNSRATIGVKACMRTPTKPVDEKYLPCIFMVEGVDEVQQHSNRSKVGYPMKRVLEVELEIVADRDTDIHALYRGVRSAVFKDGDPVVADGGTFIREIRTEGPTGYGLPDVIGMTLVLALFYTDEGN